MAAPTKPPVRSLSDDPEETEAAELPLVTSAIPSVGTPAPDFRAKAVVDGRIKELTSAQFQAANEWLLLIFIPMAWSFICPTEVRAFSKRNQEFQSRAVSVAFVSTDSEYVLKAWNAHTEAEGGLDHVRVPLISDRNCKMSRGYGVFVEEEGVAQRAAFIIDPKGTVRHFSVHDANVGRSVDETCRLVDALKFTDEFGEGCPIDWKKGDAGLDMTGEGMRRRKSSTTSTGSKRTSSGTVPRPSLSRQSTWSGILRSAGPASPTDSAAQISLPTLDSRLSTSKDLYFKLPQETVGRKTTNMSAVASNGQIASVPHYSSARHVSRHSDSLLRSPELFAFQQHREDPLDGKGRAILGSIG